VPINPGKRPAPYTDEGQVYGDEIVRSSGKPEGSRNR
jgi:hypothetical protein